MPSESLSYLIHTSLAHIFFQTRTLSDSGEEDEPEHWLEHQIAQYEAEESIHLKIPKTSNGKMYKITDLYDDQKFIIGIVLDKLHEWMTCKNFSAFKPLRMTINGSAGSGKSVVINTIVSVMRQIFGINDVVRVVAPTGTTACNINGETIHHMFGNKVSTREYEPFTMSAQKKEQLSKKFGTLLCLICDERSLLSSDQLGTAKNMLSETLYGGVLQHHPWGRLPILILVGDDYQLPSVTEGALKVLCNKKKTKKMTIAGCQAFRECADTVLSLSSSKRIKDTQKGDKELMSQLRTATNIQQSDIDKLLSLSLTTIGQKHGQNVVDKIKEESIFLFFRNEPRIHHNLIQICEHASEENPVAICKVQSEGPLNGKAIKRHFGIQNSNKHQDDGWNSSLLSVGAYVALDGRNYNPAWGLHNGAMGKVQEIVFEPGQNPNHGDLPSYVVVHFPNYSGPAWDMNDPKVRAANTQSSHKYILTHHHIPGNSNSTVHILLPIQLLQKNSNPPCIGICTHNP